MFDELRNGRVKARVVTVRNGGNVDSHCRFALSHSRIPTHFRLVEGVWYMVKYASKDEKELKPVLDMFRSAVRRADPVADEATASLTKVVINSFSQRDASGRETVRLILGDKFASSSHTFARPTIDPTVATRQGNLGNGARPPRRGTTAPSREALK